MVISATTYDSSPPTPFKRNEFTTFAYLLSAFLLPFIWLFKA